MLIILFVVVYSKIVSTFAVLISTKVTKRPILNAYNTYTLMERFTEIYHAMSKNQTVAYKGELYTIESINKDNSITILGTSPINKVPLKVGMKEVTTDNDFDNLFK